MAFVRLVLVALLFVSGSLAVTAMAAETPMTHAGAAAMAHGDHEHGGPGQGDLDCSMAVCCFALATVEPIEPPGCSLSLPRPAAGAFSLPTRTDPHERPPQRN